MLKTDLYSAIKSEDSEALVVLLLLLLLLLSVRMLCESVSNTCTQFTSTLQSKRQVTQHS